MGSVPMEARKSPRNVVGGVSEAARKRKPGGVAAARVAAGRNLSHIGPHRRRAFGAPAAALIPGPGWWWRFWEKSSAVAAAVAPPSPKSRCLVNYQILFFSDAYERSRRVTAGNRLGTLMWFFFL